MFTSMYYSDICSFICGTWSGTGCFWKEKEEIIGGRKKRSKYGLGCFKNSIGKQHLALSEEAQFDAFELILIINFDIFVID